MRKRTQTDPTGNPLRYIRVVLSMTFGFISAFALSQTISGRITDAHSGNAVAEVLISNSSGTISTTSDKHGLFSINTDKAPDSLIIEKPGYETNLYFGESAIPNHFRILPDRKNRVSVNHDFFNNRIPLVSMGNADLAIPKNHALSAVKGRIPALAVEQYTSHPGDHPAIMIRGINSLIFNQAPIILLDGIPVYNLSDINPEDISTVSVVKDISSLAIFGGQASNGAILIQTKRGETGRNRIYFSASYGIQSPASYLSMMSGERNLQFVMELNNTLLGSQDDRSAFFGNAFHSDSLIDIYHPYNNDWQKELFAPAPYQDYSLTFTGGNEKTQFRLSTSYTDMKGIIAPSESDRMSVAFNLDHKASERLFIGSTMYLTRSVYNRVSTKGSAEEGNVILSALAYPSFLPATDPDGNFFINPLRPEIDNPLANRAGYENYLSRSAAVASFFLKYTLVKNLDLKIRTSGNLALERTDLFASSYMTFFGRKNSGYGYQEGRELTSWHSEALLNYYTETNNSRVAFTSGALLYQARNAWNTAEGFGFPTDEIKLLSGAGTTLSSSNMNNYSRNAYIMKMDYSLNDKYSIVMGARAENSSRFQNAAATGFFYGLNLIWLASGEDFLAGLDNLDRLEFFVGTGRSGNDGGNMAGMLYPQFSIDTLPKINPDETYPDNKYPGAGYPTRNIQNAGWEITNEISGGIASSLFRQKLDLSLYLYTRKIQNLLLPDPVVPETIYTNQGSMSNTGFEISMSFQTYERKDFEWISGINLSHYKTLVQETGTLEQGLLLGHLGHSNIILENQPLFAFWGLRTDGLFQNQQEVDNHALQPGAEPGDIRYKDLTPDNIIDNKDKTVIGDPNPDLNIGVENTIRYKNIELNILLQGSYGAERLNLVKMQTESYNDFINMSTQAGERWVPGSEENNIPRASTGTNNSLISDRFVENADYLRLKQVTLGYNLPTSWINKMGITSTSIYLTGVNLYTLSNYSGYDPESSSYDLLGIDYGAYPGSRYLGCGIRMGF